MQYLTAQSLVFHYASDVGKLSSSSTKKIHVSEAEEILNRESGWKALTGTTNFGEIVASSDPRMKLAFDIFVDRICGYVGSYYIALEGQVDALVFAGGVGVRSEELRRRVVEKCACLGFQVDAETNVRNIENVVQDVGSRTATHRTLVCQSDEQVQMARSCVADKRFFP
jgi:acetate kinase